MPEAARETAPPPLGRRLRGSLLRITRALAIVYLGIVVLIYFLQGKLIFPGAHGGAPRAVVEAPADTEFVELTTASGERIVALFGKALDPDGQGPLADAPERPTIVFFYGNGTSLARLPRVAGALRRMGANVLIPDYVGYGMSTGRACERGCNETAAATYAWLKSRSDIDQSKVIIGGWSLGAAVAVDLASHERPAALVLLSPFTSMIEMGQTLYPWLPVRLCLAHRFESINKAPNIRCPVVILHGTEDNLIPIEMGRRLGAAFPGPVEFREIVGIDHNDLIDSPAANAGIADIVKAVAGERPRSPAETRVER